LHDGVPKIIDFGVSQTKGPYTTALHTQAGTANWMAPGNSHESILSLIQILMTNNIYRGDER
jgi:serine/threonine protein kinase